MTSNDKRRVVVTGATGYIAQQLMPVLRKQYELCLMDVKAEDRAGNPVEGVQIVDLLSADAATLQRLFDGADTVVHCGYHRATGDDPQVQYDGEKLNVDMMQRVYQLALDGAVRRVVAASTNQATKWYEQPYYQGLLDCVEPEDYPRADTFYGWAKASYEALGFLYACGTLGRKLEVVHIRIVVPREVDAANFENRSRAEYVRDLAGYISERDLQQLFTRSIEAERIEDEHGIPFQIFYGVSNNARTFWSITNARKVIGYTPEDDSEVRFAEGIDRLLR